MRLGVTSDAFASIASAIRAWHASPSIADAAPTSTMTFMLSRCRKNCLLLCQLSFGQTLSHASRCLLMSKLIADRAGASSIASAYRGRYGGFCHYCNEAPRAITADICSSRRRGPNLAARPLPCSAVGEAGLPTCTLCALHAVIERS